MLQPNKLFWVAKRKNHYHQLSAHGILLVAGCVQKMYWYYGNYYKMKILRFSGFVQYIAFNHKDPDNCFRACELLYAKIKILNQIGIPIDPSYSATYSGWLCWNMKIRFSELISLNKLNKIGSWLQIIVYKATWKPFLCTICLQITRVDVSFHTSLQIAFPF